MSTAAAEHWLPGDVYFGDAEKPLPDWRVAASESDTDDDAPLSPEERKALVGMLGFDPRELSVDLAVAESLLLEAGFTGTDSHGHKWVQGKQVKREDNRTADAIRVPASGGNAPTSTASSPKQQSSALDKGLDSQLKDLPPTIKQGVFGKIRDAVHKLAVKVNWASLAPDILDTIEDTQKIWYRQAPPIPGVPLSSGQLVAVGSYVLAKAVLWAKKKLGGARPAVEAAEPPADPAQAVDVALAFFEEMAAAGLGKAPTREQLEKIIGQRQVAESAAREALLESWLLEAGFTGTKDVMVRGKPQKWHYVNGKRVAAQKLPAAAKKPGVAEPAPAAKKPAAPKPPTKAQTKAADKATTAKQTAEAKQQAMAVIKDALAHPQKITQDFLQSAGEALMTFKVDELKVLKKELGALGAGKTKADLVAQIKKRAIEKAAAAAKAKPVPPPAAPAPKAIPVAPPTVAKPAAPASAHAKVAAAFRAKIEATPHLSPAQKQEYAASMDHVINRLPAGAIARIQKSVQKIGFYSNTKQLGEGLAVNNPNIAQMVQRGATINGAFSPKDGKLHLDGRTEQRGDVAEVGGKKSGMRGTYAHELGHAVDWDPASRQWTFSGTKEWAQIAEAEIGVKPENARLSAYATTNKQESFAEMYRLVHGTDVDKGLIEKRFPRASKYLKDNKLW